MKLTIVCSWCGVKIGEKECDTLDENLPRITHSTCDECKTKILNDLKHSDNKNRNGKSQFTKERRF